MDQNDWQPINAGETQVFIKETSLDGILSVCNWKFTYKGHESRAYIDKQP